MADPKSEIDDLSALKREAERLSSGRADAQPSVDSTATQSGPGEAAPTPLRQEAEEAAAGDPAAGDPELAIHELALQIESVVREMEDTARERPALALLMAFAVGVAVGQLFSRR